MSSRLLFRPLCSSTATTSSAARSSRQLIRRRLLSSSTVAPVADDTSCQHTTTGPIATTTVLEIVDCKDKPKWPVFRVLDPRGFLLDGVDLPEIDYPMLVKKYTVMGKIRAFDDIMYNAQRQGRISFYMQNLGEEATHIGSASALRMQDMVFAQYRELGVLLWRGFSVQQAADQCFSNIADKGKGRQMPVHYGDKSLNFQTIASPLATQMPQAVGAAFAYKAKNRLAAQTDPSFDLERDGAIAICYFGEGAASEGDAHAAFNFSATLDVPMLFFCRNNGFAISTPTADQFRGDGIISRAAGYGMKAIRVDGNDILAVEIATREARKIALEQNCPVLIEAMTYRGGHHSTSDDSTRYRSTTEIDYWLTNFDPMRRLRLFLESKGHWDDEQEQRMKDEERMGAIQAMETAEGRQKPPLSEMFTDIYEEPTLALQQQAAEMHEHIKRHENYYHDGHGH